MDRTLKAFDRVHVYQSDIYGERIDIVELQPYSHAGLDNYLYKGVMYKGFVYPSTRGPYILLDQPLFPSRQ